MKIRDIIKMIEKDGWYLVTTKGSHRQYKHSIKSGRVTMPAIPAMIWRRVLSTAF